ncbi:MAG: ABC transporter substrate-binding protein, partial [Promethearchaeota archaeon]
MNSEIKKRVRMGHLSTFYHTCFLLMDSNDLNLELGAQIEGKLYGTGPEMIQDFKRGNLDGGYLGLPPAIIGIESGVPIKCVASGHIEGTMMIAKNNYKSLKESGNDLTKVLNQFSNLRIGVTSKGSIHDVIIGHYLKALKLHDKVR